LVIVEALEARDVEESAAQVANHLTPVFAYSVEGEDR
jgi:hypothetical protein